jgi:hypothetical protein
VTERGTSGGVEITSTGLLDAVHAAFVEGWKEGRELRTDIEWSEKQITDIIEQDWAVSDAKYSASNA